MRRPDRFLACTLLLLPTLAVAQRPSAPVDPEANRVVRPADEAPERSSLNPDDELTTEQTVDDDPVDPKLLEAAAAAKLATERAEKEKAEKEKKAKEAKEAQGSSVPVEPEKPKAVPGFVLPRAGDAELAAAFEAWRKANASPDVKAEAAARAELLRLREELGGTNFDVWAVGLVRASAVSEAKGDSAGAIELASTAVELAPELPSAHLGLARAYFAADPADPARYARATLETVGKLLKEPRFARALFGDFAAALLIALIATAVAVTCVLFAKAARYFFYDFHLLFPRLVARWQTAILALALLALPVVFRLGVAPSLLTIFLAASFYLTVAERLTAALLIAALGVVPTAAGLVAERTGFAGTTAELVDSVQRGGSGAELQALELTRRVAEDKASWQELFALGSFELRRGKLELAVAHLKAALAKKPKGPRISSNLATAMLAGGDTENPTSLYEEAARGEPRLAAPLYNLAQLYRRRVALYGAAAAGEVDKVTTALDEAKARDPGLANRQPPAGDKLPLNAALITLPLAQADLFALAVTPEVGERVRSQFSGVLMGDVNEGLAPFYPAAVALLILALGGLSTAMGSARGCTKCGDPVSRRGDPELPRHSAMCQQCINVYAKKGVVAPSLKVRKQLEVARFNSRTDRISYGLGLLCSGAGHVFKGLPVRGTAFAFLFLFVVCAFLFRNGLLRPVYEGAPTWLKLLPLGVLFLGVYGLSLRGLSRRSS